MDAKEFYDDYVDRQVSVGINDRHESIMRFLDRAGIQSDHRVLEIGCGIGTLTQLLVKRVGPSGRVVALDLSPRSIEVAEERLGAIGHLQLLAGDFFELDVPGEFDAVVLPDVIEHIPLELHGTLFERIAARLAPGGFVLAHYPNPHFLAWCHEHRQDLLQAIDQPIHAHELLVNAAPHGLYLDYLETYSIWVREGDYVVAMLRLRADQQDFEWLPSEGSSLLTRARHKVARLRR